MNADPSTGRARGRLYEPQACTVLGLLVNALLTIGKITVGVFSRSSALVADGAHSLSDLAGDFGILFALRSARRPADADHPYGHHQFETLGGVGVSLLLLVTGVLIGNAAVHRLIAGENLVPTLPALAVAIASLVIKEILARYTLKAGRLNNSPALAANAAHHRSDALSSLAASVGIGGAMLGWPLADSLMAIVIAGFILHMGWTLLRENSMLLMDTQPSREILETITTDTMQVEGVHSLSELRVRQRGSYYLVDLSIGVAPELTVTAGHSIAHEVEERLRRRNPHLSAVFVHVEPSDR